MQRGSKPSTSTARAPARPRDAGTLVLVRRGAHGAEVLIGRRPPRSRFMPGFFVFPGGALEASDSRVGVASALRPGVVDHSRVGGRTARARAIAVAAIRETFEETGLLVAAPGEVGCDAAAWAAARERGLAPDLARLAFVGRAITPASNRIRFHARFFVTRAEHCHGRLTGSDELSDLHWSPVDAVARLPVARVTVFMLERALRVDAHPEAHRNASVLVSSHGETRRFTVFVDENGQGL